ncbi:MAG: hypothetical protein JWP82_3019 [Humibacillus sp.]|nr:hypothetical protein [Humibacillus sp.]
MTDTTAHPRPDNADNADNAEGAGATEPTDLASAELADTLESIETVEAPAAGEPAASPENEEHPVADAPVEDAPAEDAPADEAPAEDAPTEDAPAEDAPAEDAPVEDAPVDEAPAEDAPAEDAPVEDAPAVAPSSVPKPSAIPTPAALARSVPHPTAPAAPPVVESADHSASASFGRVDETGTVFVRTTEGEREVGSYPGASDADALTYFARKYDELFASAVLLEQRLALPEVPSKDVADGLKTLRAQVKDAAVVGDLDALAAKLDEIQSGIASKRTVEQAHRAEARAAATAEREAIVSEAETIAGQPESKIQWKTSGARMRELLDEWKAHQRASTRLDRDTESSLWTRFSAARNGFDKARRTHFAGLDAAHGEAKSEKERLVAEAEKLSTSTDWASTAGAFKRLMDDWRRAGRASRTDDDRLWSRFKAAQDSFFAAKDEVVAAEEEGFRGNLAVKEALLVEAEAILPVTDLERAKGQLRAVQEKWDAAGKVPRADMERVEKAMRRVEQTVRDAEDRRWVSSNPEVAARARAMVDQLERAVADLEDDLAKAEASGNASKVKKAREALDARQVWLDQARAGVQEFGG